ELEHQLEAVRQRLGAIEGQWGEAKGTRGEIKSKQEAALMLFEQVSVVLEQVDIDDTLLQRLAGWRAGALDEHQLYVESCDNREQDVRKWLQDRIDAEDKRLARLSERIVNAMRGFNEEFKAETAEIDVSLAALPEYERLLAGLQGDDLPRF